MPEASTCAIATRGRSPIEVATSETEISLGTFGVQTDTISIAALPGYNPVYKRYDWEGNFIENLMPNTAKFTLKRLGGCGGGRLTVIADIADYDNLPDLHDIISIEYTDGTPWYRGYVVKCKVGLNGNATIELAGYANLMKEVKVGPLAYGDKANWTKPPWVSQEDWDNAWSEIEQLPSVTNIGDIVNNLILRYNAISALYHLPQVTGSEIDDFAIELKCIAFKSNLSYFEAFTHLALWAKAGWGVDESGVFFFKKKRQDVLREFRVKWNAAQFDREKSKDYLYNIVSIMGLFTLKISFWNFSVPYFYTCYDQDSIDQFGPRGYPNILWAPQIGCQEDATAFASGFFETFADADYNFAAQDAASRSLVRPWKGLIAFKGENNIILTERYCDKVDYSFRKDVVLDVAAGKELMLENWAIYKGRSGDNPSGRDDWPKVYPKSTIIETIYPKANRNIFDIFLPGEEVGDGIGDGVTGPGDGLAGNKHFIDIPPGFQPPLVAWVWEKAVLNYAVADLPETIIKAEFRVRLVSNPQGTIADQTCYLAHYNKNEPQILLSDYEASCTDLYSFSVPEAAGEEITFDVTNKILADRNAGKDYSTFKVYFKGNEQGSGYIIFQREALLITTTSY